jgi:hypothetical protein
MMFSTTLTTCSAFLATALLSPMVAMQCLGYITFASLLFDYLLVLSFYAACLVLCHERTRHPAPSLDGENPPLEPMTLDSNPDENSQGGATGRLSSDGVAPSVDGVSPAASRDEPADPQRAKAWTSRWLSGAFSCFRDPGRLRFPVIGGFAVLLLPFIAWHLRNLNIDSMPPSFLRWDHPMQRAYLDNADFATSPLDVFDTVHFFWGLAPGALDLRGVDRLRNKSFTGEPMLDRRFQFDGAAQLHLLSVCATLRASKLVSLADNFASESALEKAVFCWPEAFRSFVVQSGMAFPIDDPTRAEEVLLDWLSAEVGLDEAKGSALAQDIGFIHLEDRRSGSGGSGDQQGVEQGSRVLRFVKLRASSTIKAAFPPPYWQLEEQYRGWQQLVARVNAVAPPSAAHAIQVLVTLPGASSASDLANKWIQVSMHLAYVTLTATGLTIGLAVCLPVLLLSTRSWTISAIASACLVCVILGVLASMLACGWKVGMVEALCLIIVSGLSVDPVLHIASAFSQASPCLNPLNRAQHAVERMGPPLLASAATTLASAVSLSTCQLTLLSKIGLFMIFSTVWSLGVSVTLLPALLATFGPAPTGWPYSSSWPSTTLHSLRRDSTRDAMPLEDSITSAP